MDETRDRTRPLVLHFVFHFSFFFQTPEHQYLRYSTEYEYRFQDSNSNAKNS